MSVGILQLGDVIDHQHDFKTWDNFCDVLPGSNHRAVEKFFGNLQLPNLCATSIPISLEVFVEVAQAQEVVV